MKPKRETLDRWVRQLLRLHGIHTIDWDDGWKAVGVQPKRWALVADLYTALLLVSEGKRLPKLEAKP